MDALCAAPSAGPLFPSYKLTRRIKLTILRGYFFVRLSKSRALKAGDLLALKTRGGQFHHRHIVDGEQPDWRLDDGNPPDPLKFISSGQIIPISGIKFMAKVLFYEGTRHFTRNGEHFSRKLALQ